MFMLRRSCRRSVLIHVKSLHARTGAGVMDTPPTLTTDSPWTNGSHSLCMEGFQGDLQKVSVKEAKKLLHNVSEGHTDGTSLQGIQDGYTIPVPGYERTGQAGFNTMQGAFKNRRTDGHTAGLMSQYQPSRKLSTSSAQGTTSVQDSANYEFDHHFEDPTPQGIQGDDCVRFKLWMENCQRYSLPNCDEQMQAIRTGRKTLAEVFMEQQMIIEKVAEDWRKKNRLRSKQSQASSQGIQDSVYNFEFLDMNDPCPQGLQGDDCANYKAWAHNCKALGFGDCAEKLQSVRDGQRTLQDLFDEQDKLIRDIVKDFQQKRKYSTSSKSEVRSSQPSTSTSSVDNTSTPTSTSSSDGDNSNNGDKLSQKDKLKRAVKEYGGTVVVFHIGISLISLGGFYVAVSSGLDVVGLLTKLGVGTSILNSKVAAGSTTFVIAYAVHKVFAPVRIGITLTCAPLLVRHLRKIGFLKPPKPKGNDTS